MAYLKINKARLEFLLRFGAGDDELRRFFSDKRVPLIQKGAKVQNLPRDPEDRIITLLSLPSGTDPIVQAWFSVNLTMIDPVPVDELVGTFQLYEKEDVNLPEGDAKRLSRSCLIYLFSIDPPSALIEFLKTPLVGNGQEPEHETDIAEEIISQQPPTVSGLGLLESGLASAMVALLENKDPDQYLSNLPPATASFISGLYAIREGQEGEVRNSIEDLSESEQAKLVLTQYAERLSKKKELSKRISTGIQLVRFEEVGSPEFDFDRDEILGKCIKDSPETAVFVQPFAMRTWDGKLVSLEKLETRERLFPKSGDVQSFSGRFHPRQPTRSEIGIWHIAPNEAHAASAYRNNFHLKGTKTEVYEVLLVPFPSTDYESVRGYIKEQIVRLGKKQLEPPLFLLRDDLIVGCVSGKDLSKDEGFDDGLPCWRALTAFRFEGRMLVPGPLPVHEIYECATLASTLKKFLSGKKSDSEKPTKTQLKYLLDSINSGEAHLNAERKVRLLRELKDIDNDDGAITPLLEEALAHEKIAARIEQLIQEKVDEQTEKKREVVKELEQLEKKRDALKESVAKQEREQRSLPSSVSKAIKESIRKAKENGLDTLGQVVVFKALMEVMGEPHSVESTHDDSSPKNFRILDHHAKSVLDILKPLGLSPKHAKALEVTGELVFSLGMILIIEGVAARLAAEAWGRKDEMGCVIMDCEIGLTDDRQIRRVATGETRSIVILDANLSPPDVYARPLIDRVQRRIIDSEHLRAPKIIMSLANGVACLPLPSNVEALSVRVSLDRKPEFLREEEAAARLDDMQDEDAGETWASRLWKPARYVLFQSLKDMPLEDAALVLSVLEVDNS